MQAQWFGWMRSRISLGIVCFFGGLIVGVVLLRQSPVNERVKTSPRLTPVQYVIPADQNDRVSPPGQAFEFNGKTVYIVPLAMVQR